MMSTKRIVEVAGEKALMVTERVPGYRGQLVRALIDTILAQSEEVSDKGRRDRVTKVVEGLGSRVSAELGEA